MRNSVDLVSRRGRQLTDLGRPPWLMLPTWGVFIIISSVAKHSATLDHRAQYINFILAANVPRSWTLF